MSFAAATGLWIIALEVELSEVAKEVNAVGGVRSAWKRRSPAVTSEWYKNR